MFSIPLGESGIGSEFPWEWAGVFRIKIGASGIVQDNFGNERDCSEFLWERVGVFRITLGRIGIGVGFGSGSDHSFGSRSDCPEFFSQSLQE